MKLTKRLTLVLNTLQRQKLPLMLGAIGTAFLMVGIFAPSLNEQAKGFVGNLFAEAVGIFLGSAITIAVIDELLAKRELRARREYAFDTTEALLFDVAVRALWGSEDYIPNVLGVDRNRSDSETWRTIIGVLARGTKWNEDRLAANEPAPEELSNLSPRIWDVIAVSPEKMPSLNVARKAAVVAGCANDLETIATQLIPELVDDFWDARSSSAVITHWVSVLRNTHLVALNKGGPDSFFAHVGGVIWEVLFVLDESFHDIPHPLRPTEKEEEGTVTKGEINE